MFNILNPMTGHSNCWQFARRTNVMKMKFATVDTGRVANVVLDAPARSHHGQPNSPGERRTGDHVVSSHSNPSSRNELIVCPSLHATNIKCLAATYFAGHRETKVRVWYSQRHSRQPAEKY